ncbi:MAG: hypothetical protein ACTII9_09265, partial [Psychrobacter celer]
MVDLQVGYCKQALIKVVFIKQALSGDKTMWLGYRQFEIKSIRFYECAIGTNFPCVLLSQRLQKTTCHLAV